MKVPNADRAVVDIRKLRDYCLNPTHPYGKFKARVFRAALGITSADAALLREWLLRAVRESDAEPGLSNEHGTRYRVDFHAVHRRRRARVRSVWIVGTGEDFPRLVSCYVI